MKHNKVLKGITATALALTVPMSMLVVGGFSVSAASGDENVSEGTKIYFDVASTNWKNYKEIYCHIWRADGTGTWTSWQTRKELCKKASDGLYYYDIAKTGNADEILAAGSNNYYCVIFSADTGVQTYNTIMNGDCLGDTCYMTGNVFENPEDSNKTCAEAAWKNHPECGAQKVITSTGKVIGNALAAGTTDVTLAADFVIKYVSDEGVADTHKTDMLGDIVNALNVNQVELEDCVKDKIHTSLLEGSITEESAQKKLATIMDVIDKAYTFNPEIDPYDFNVDGRVDVQDVTAFQIIISQQQDSGLTEGIDINEDGIIDVQDVTAFQLYLAQQAA